MLVVFASAELWAVTSILCIHWAGCWVCMCEYSVSRRVPWKRGRLRKTVSLYLSLLQEGGRRPAASVQKAFIECCWSCLSSQRLAVIFSLPLYLLGTVCHCICSEVSSHTELYLRSQLLCCHCLILTGDWLSVFPGLHKINTETKLGNGGIHL